MNKKEAILTILAIVVAIMVITTSLVYVLYVDDNQDNSNKKEPENTRANVIEECQQLTPLSRKIGCFVELAAQYRDPQICTKLPNEEVATSDGEPLRFPFPPDGFQEVTPRNYCLGRYMRVMPDERTCSVIEGNDKLKQYCQKQYDT